MASYLEKTTASEIVKSRKQGGDDAPSTAKASRADRRAEKEKEEMRKAGTEPAIKDIDTGRDINPHIPQFIASAPWYTVGDKKGPTLKHQRPHDEREAIRNEVAKIDEWYKRGVTEKVATKFRKGACENCGAMTHKKRDCFERPRKMGARYTHEDIAPDEFEQPKLKLNFDAKRDRWNGYDPAEHKHVIEEFARLEEARKMLKAQEEANKDAEDEDKYAETADMPGVKTDMESATRITVRNLRIREDTAKYLYNLDPNSAYYDPKSRSMRENPFEGTNKVLEASKFAGENFVKYTGEVHDVNSAQIFAWDAKRRGIDVHAIAEPTKLEMLKREYESKKKEAKSSIQDTIFEKYGGKQYLKEGEIKDLLGAQTEAYVEYNRRGEVIKGAEKPVVRSIYEEDVFRNNHTSIFGSYWYQGQWGYACCHSFVYNSYCTGTAGKEAMRESLKQAKKELKEEIKNEIKQEIAAHGSLIDLDAEVKPEKNQSTKRKRKKSSSSSSSSDSSDTELSSSEDEKKNKKRKRETKSDDQKLTEALDKQKRQKAEAEKQLKCDERKRAYNKNYETSAPTNYDMEAYALTDKFASADPMANYMESKKSK